MLWHLTGVPMSVQMLNSGFIIVGLHLSLCYKYMFMLKIWAIVVVWKNVFPLNRNRKRETWNACLLCESTLYLCSFQCTCCSVEYVTLTELGQGKCWSQMVVARTISACGVSICISQA